MTEARMTFGIIGCGLIGASWAALAASAGYPVRAWDPEEAARKNFLARMAAAQAQLSALGMTGKADVVLADTLQDVARDCRWIQENAPERLELARRYLGTEGGDAFIAANPGSADDVLIRMTPERWISVDYGNG